MEFLEAVKYRRSQYDISNESPLTKQEIENLLKDTMTYVPSAFHSQTSRTILLFDDAHQKLWSIVKSTLQAIVPEDKFAPTEAKISAFAKGYGTILFFEDMDVVKELQESFPFYADNFPVWSNQSSSMLQYAVWTALSSQGLGCSLQHYNPLIDEAVMREFDCPSSWELRSQMPFGKPMSKPKDITYMPIAERMIVRGITK